MAAGSVDVDAEGEHCVFLPLQRWCSRDKEYEECDWQAWGKPQSLHLPAGQSTRYSPLRIQRLRSETPTQPTVILVVEKKKPQQPINLWFFCFPLQNLLVKMNQDETRQNKGGVAKLWRQKLRGDWGDVKKTETCWFLFITPSHNFLVYSCFMGLNGGI